MKITAVVVFVLTLGGLVVAYFTYRAYRRDMDHADNRLSGGSQMVTTRCGPIEYASKGNGVPVLVVHGAGGGFDQVLDSEAVGSLSRNGFRLILVSRFGYLSTPLPSDASAEAQADAHACLLDALGIQRVAIVAISAGAPSGLQFCLRHPDRCSALVLLVPATFVPGQEAKTGSAPPLTQFLSDTVLKSDFAFWLATKVARRVMIENILATPANVAEGASAGERRRLHAVLMNILPVSKRRAGLLNDAAVVASLPHADFRQIKAPTLLISVEDDLYGTFRGARHLAGQIPGARLVMYTTGGHLWVGHDEEVQAEIAAFLQGLR